MSSIRPLFTITILLVVGGYLYWKINEGPAKPRAAQEAESNQIGDGVPPLAATGASLNSDASAPAWPPAAPAAPANETATSSDVASAAPAANESAAAPAESDVTQGALPEVPPIPELPELPSTSSAAPIAPPVMPTTTAPVAVEPPKSPADSRYGDAAGPSLNAGSPAGPSTINAPDLPMPGDAAAPAMPLAPGQPAATLDPPSVNSVDTSNTLPLGGAAVPAIEPVNTPPLTAAPAAAVPAAAPSVDRYGLPIAPSSAPAAGPAAATPSTPAPTGFPAAPSAQLSPAAAAGESFAASWPAIQAALDSGDLKQAHQLLSKWHGNETLSAADSEKVEGLLAQLAGTVIYSTEHQLEPARVVKTGETLESIAREYNVPWQLLGKINNVQSPDQIRPGQQLKVVRGPFTAIVDLHRNELTLEVDGRYAGTFPVAVPPGTTVAEGQWLVDQKTGAATSGVTPASYPSAPAAAEPAIVLRSEAGAAGSATAPTLMITSGAPAAPGAATSLRVSPQDASDLSDILSIGSRVVVRR